MPTRAKLDLRMLDQKKAVYEAGWGNAKQYKLNLVAGDPSTSLYLDDPRDRVSVEILKDPYQGLPLRPDKPDILFARGDYKPFPRTLLFFETGADTKQFVTATVMTTLTLTPKELPKDQRATMRVHSRNWPDKMDTLTLTETAPGSRRFVNEDGSVAYELAWIMDEQKNLVPAASPETSNYLYFYITDPTLGLDRAPQIVWETGVDTGEYRSWAEPDLSVLNGGEGPWAYKPWPQTEQELKDSQFTVEVSGPAVAPGSKLRALWDEPGKGEVHADVGLIPGKNGGFVTAQPFLCFTLKGCDIGGTWKETDSHPTPRIPGAVTIRENNLRFVVVSGP